MSFKPRTLYLNYFSAFCQASTERTEFRTEKSGETKQKKVKKDLKWHAWLARNTSLIHDAFMSLISQYYE